MGSKGPRATGARSAQGNKAYVIHAVVDALPLAVRVHGHEQRAQQGKNDGGVQNGLGQAAGEGAGEQQAKRGSPWWARSFVCAG